MGNAPSQNRPRDTQNIPSSRPLKQKKRSIVAHPPLSLQSAVTAAATTTAAPSNPIPIPNNNPNPVYLPPRQLNTPPDDSDIVPELISRDRPDPNSHHAPRPLQYNSTRSFGQVRRGGIQGGGWSDQQQQQSDRHSQQQPEEEEPVEEEFVHSSIPLGLLRAEQEAGLLEEGKDDESDEQDETTRLFQMTLVWRQGGSEVFVAGTFHELEWRARERLRYDPTTNSHTITLSLPPGTYRIKFIKDDVWSCSTDLPTATDDETGNLVNYILVEDTIALDLAAGQSDERQGREGRAMKANRKRTYPPRASRQTAKSPVRTSTNAGKAWHPPLLPPSDSFWGVDTHGENSGWEHGRDGVLEKWTNVIPESLIAAAHQEEAYLSALDGERDARRGGGSVGSRGIGMSTPMIPSAPRLPRHLERLILNTKLGGNGNGGGNNGSRNSKSGRQHRSRTPGLAMTSSLAPEAKNTSAAGLVGMSGGGLPVTKSGSMAAMEQWVSADDTSVLPVPNHVVLHHLGTSAIRNSVLAVSDTNRYNNKYITTIYYKPV